jgi:hypothetical protein
MELQDSYIVSEKSKSAAYNKAVLTTLLICFSLATGADKQPIIISN